MIGPEEADEVLQDWGLLIAAAGVESIGMAPLPPPPLNFPDRPVRDRTTRKAHL